MMRIRAFICLLYICGIVLGRGPTPSQAHTRSTPLVSETVASYSIQVRLEPSAKQLFGIEQVTFTNIQPEPVTDLVFHLYLNAFRDQNSIFLQESGTTHRGFSWDPDFPGWMNVNALKLASGQELVLELMDDGTLARAALPEPLAQYQTLVFNVEFTAQLPRVFARTGFASRETGDDFFMVGQWFPKLGVWQQGQWNAYPFHANSEFFSDFGDYDVFITLPDEYITGASGTLEESRLDQLGHRIDHYHAPNVIDFAWTASPHFQTASDQAAGVEITYLYLPQNQWTVDRVLSTAVSAMKSYSEWFGDYPYPRLTIVDVPADGQGAGGMEYPNLVTAGTMSITGLPSNATRNLDRSLELVVAHEVGHQWWQSMVATNEAEEPWLDEGFTDYSTMRLVQQLYGGRSAFDAGSLALSYLDLRRLEYLMNPSLPMVGKSWEFTGLMDYGIAVYSKPALSLLTLENYLGSEKMLKLMRTYFTRYQFKHPTTLDFRRVAEEVSDQDLSWFFDGLAYGNGTLNYAVTALEPHQAQFERQGELTIPVEIQLAFSDGTSKVELWDGSSSHLVLTFDDVEIDSVQIDPNRKILVDTNWLDNGWSRKTNLNSWMALVIRLVYTIQNLLLTLGGY